MKSWIDRKTKALIDAAIIDARLKKSYQRYRNREYRQSPMSKEQFKREVMREKGMEVN